MLRNPAYQGMSYPDRWKMAVTEHKQLTIYVPAEGGITGRVLAPRSGIVGEVMTDGKVLVYFEGWVVSAYQYESLDARGKWEAGVETAAGRMLTEYPTIARRAVNADELIAVGYYHCSNGPGERIRIFQEDEVAKWLA